MRREIALTILNGHNFVHSSCHDLLVAAPCCWCDAVSIDLRKSYDGACQTGLGSAPNFSAGERLEPSWPWSYVACAWRQWHSGRQAVLNAMVGCHVTCKRFRVWGTREKGAASHAHTTLSHTCTCAAPAKSSSKCGCASPLLSYSHALIGPCFTWDLISKWVCD